MDSAAIRAMLPPTLPRTPSKESPPDQPEDAPGRRIHPRAPEAFHRRTTAFPGDAAAPLRPAPHSPSRLRSSVPPVAPAPDRAPEDKRPAVPAALVSRIVEAVRLRTCAGTRIRIALSPEHLGELVLELVQQGSVVHGKILAENESARRLLSSQLDLLRDSLEDQGIRVGELRVSPGDSADEAADEPAPLRSLRRHRVDVLA